MSSKWPWLSAKVIVAWLPKIWAQTWRRCPKKGCRRARRCLRFHRCAAVSREPYWPTAKDKRRYFDPLYAALRQIKGGPAKHDPDERDRNRADSPLKAADDAVLLDSTDMTLDQAVKAAEEIVASHLVS